MKTPKHDKAFHISAAQAGIAAGVLGSGAGFRAKRTSSPGRKGIHVNWNPKRFKSGVLLGTGVYAGVKTAQHVKGKRNAKQHKNLH